jgi:hypothetical protein
MTPCDNQFLGTWSSQRKSACFENGPAQLLACISQPKNCTAATPAQIILLGVVDADIKTNACVDYERVVFAG